MTEMKYGKDMDRGDCGEKREVSRDVSSEIQVGCSLPYGPRMYYQSPDNLVRMKDYGVSKRIIVIGALGSFTPDCWNRHLYLVLKYYNYYKERGVDHFICISTNDAFAQQAWGASLGCSESVMMWSDPIAKYTNALGMGVVVPWLDGRTRCRRFVLLADDMEVKKFIKCEQDNGVMKWDCNHLLIVDDEDEESSVENQS